MDLSNSAVSSTIAPFPRDPGSRITFNINGLLKLGSGFTMLNFETEYEGQLIVNIKDGGQIDATKTNYFQPNCFVTSGSGILIQKVESYNNFTISTSPTVFRSFQTKEVDCNSSVSIENKSAVDTFSVGVKMGFDYSVNDTAKVVKKQWNISERVVGGNSVNLTLGWKKEEQAVGFDPSKPVSIIRYNGTEWEQFPASVSGYSTDYRATAKGITSFGAFGIQNTKEVMPLNLLSFDVRVDRVKHNVVLTWSTTNEVNTREFIIERSLNNQEFKTLGKVNSRNLMSINHYSLTDASPQKGVNYYRLRQVDQDGGYKYSGVLIATLKTVSKLEVFPNPVKDKATVTFPPSPNSYIKIASLDGRVLKQHSLSPNSTSKEISLKGLSRGTYLLIYQSAIGRETIKLIKE